MFIDHVIVEVAAGRGGDGCVSFRRESHVPRGGPDGGDGGRGGSVVVEATDRISSLVDLHYKRLYKAKNGHHGQGKSKTGKDGVSVQIPVPVGTIVRDIETGRLVADLTTSGMSVVVAKGGKGGLGNERFKSAKNQAPTKATPGKPGGSQKLELVLKLIADVGLVGEPNAGKSTLISVLSAAHPKIASYPFTTKTPVLGIVKTGEFESLVMVDIPGLIEGAHAGKGMGKEFLRHVERCRVLLFLVDVTLANAAESYRALRNELLKYDPKLLEKPSMMALTKCDLLEGGVDGVDSSLLEMHSNVVPISAVTKQGLKSLLHKLRSAVSE